MAIVTPQTDLVLLKCPLEVDQQNQLTFSNSTAQYNYFNSLPKLAVNDFTYQRKDGTVRFPAQIDDIRSYNYCMYRNDAYSNKWFYAFITGMRYANDGVTEIKLKTDVWQTWCLNINVRTSFVEREHTNNDAVGENILDEGLNVGEYTVNAFSDNSFMANNQDYWVAVQLSDVVDGFPNPSAKVLNGILQGCYTFLLEPSDTTNFNHFTRRFDREGKADAIVAMYILPKSFAPQSSLSGQTIMDPTGDLSIDIWYLPKSINATNLGTLNITRNTTIDGYTPKNNKLFCYPYNYLMISNNGGEDNVYHWEDFTTSTAQFTMRGVATQGCQIRLTPSNYKKTTLAGGYAWSTTALTLPLLSWNSDYYLNWQAKNGIQSGFKAAQSYTSDYMAAGEAVSKDASQITPENVLTGIGKTLSSFGQVFSSMMSEVSGGYSASITPDETRGVVTGDLSYALGKCGFTNYKMSIKSQQARMIDDYVWMFGYRTDRLKVPNITGRRYWNFVKTKIVNITGDIPQDDMNEIKSYFNAGITFWHDTTKYLDYSQNNAIV